MVAALQPSHESSPNLSQPNPGLRPSGSPCKSVMLPIVVNEINFPTLHFLSHFWYDMASSYCCLSESARLVPQGVVCHPGRCSYPALGGDGLCRDRRGCCCCTPGFERLPGSFSGSTFFLFPSLLESACMERADATGVAAVLARQAKESEQAMEVTEIMHS